MLVISEWIPDDSLDWLRSQEISFLYDPRLYQNAEALSEALGQARGLVVRNRTQVTASLLAAGPELRAVGRLGVGLDNLDLAACQQRGVTVIVPRGANAPSVVEYVVGALLWHYRAWAEWLADTKNGIWNRQRGGQEIYGKTVGIVGYGDIGHRVEEALRALGANILVFDPHLGPFDRAVMQHHVCRSDTLASLLEQSDVVTLHAPLNPSTFHLLDDEMLRHMHPHAVLINTARGDLIDEIALAAHLERRRFDRVILDVRAEEPPPLPDALAAYDDRVWLTPHIAGMSHPAQDRIAQGVFIEISRYLI